MRSRQPRRQHLLLPLTSPPLHARLSRSLVDKSGGINDLDIFKLTVTGNGGISYTLTCTNVEIDSATQFTLILNAVD